ncbi:hypothetical protein [Kitasatospora sp. NPDC047058]|uniref:hypothetical protein n=1 Tax=Kitasatospora sp. NPDC047058 TaxID=3155620 RepID=UPI0033F51846
MSGVSVELIGGPYDGVLTVLPNGRPEVEFRVPMPVSPAEWWAVGPGEVVPLRVGVYRRSDAVSAAGAVWVYRWVGEPA